MFKVGRMLLESSNDEPSTSAPTDAKRMLAPGTLSI